VPPESGRICGGGQRGAAHRYLTRARTELPARLAGLPALETKDAIGAGPPAPEEAFDWTDSHLRGFEVNAALRT